MAEYEFLTSSGVIVADTSDLKEAVEAEYKDAFGIGEGESIDSSSYLGRHVDAELTSRLSVMRNNALMANQLNPNMAYAWAFDSEYALMGGARDAAEQSTCDCIMSGVAGTVISAGAYAKDDNGELWTLVSEATIPAEGSITKTFRSENYGPIGAAIGEINSIVSGVVGWETITNEVAATQGKEQQTLISAKLQRRVEIGANSRSTAYSVLAAVSQLDGVASIQFRENSTDDSLVVDGITIPRKATWLCVDGGALSEIAEAYYTNRWGTDFYGFSNTEDQDFIDPESGQTTTTKIDRPTDVPMKIKVTAKVLVSSNAIDNIKDAVIAYANGEIDGGKGFVLGNDVSPYEIGWSINAYMSPPSIFISSVEVTTVSDDSYTTSTVPVALWEKASITTSNIDVVITT